MVDGIINFLNSRTREMSRSFQHNPLWTKCNYCVKKEFSDSSQFVRHLREVHCSQEGGSFVCHYGDNNICYSLPVVGVNDIDYEKHVYQHHTLGMPATGNSQRTSFSSPLLEDRNEQEKWTVYSASQFLPSVLNDPSKPKKKDFFTKTWGESFVENSEISNSNYIPQPSSSAIDHYLKRLGKKHKKHLKLLTVTSKPVGHFELLQNFPHLKIGKFPDKNRLDINVVPKIFLSSNFSLNNLQTFNEVFSHLCNDSKSENIFNDCANKLAPIPPNSSKILQEKLSHYLDIIEVQIAQQVSQKSEAFFQAMTSHDVVMEQLSQNICLVKTLREKIQKMDQNMVFCTLRIVKLERWKANYWQVYKKLKLMSTVMQTQPTIKLLLSSPDYIGALDLIHTTLDLLAQELSGIHSFRHLSSELSEMLKVIDTLMTEELERYSTADLNRPFDEPGTLDEDKLSCILMGMMRRGDYSFLDLYEREITAAVKAGVKQAVIEIVAESPGHQDDPLEDRLKSLTVTEWVALIANASKFVISLLVRVKHVHEVMHRTANFCAGIKSSSDQEDIVCETNDWRMDDVDYGKLKSRIDALLEYACEYSQDKCAQLLSSRTLRSVDDKVRDEVKVVSNSSSGWLADRANTSQLKEMARYVDRMTARCEEICPQGKNVNSLRTAFNVQANKFMSRFHREKLQKLMLILESEQWRLTEVPFSFQCLVDHISEKGQFNVTRTELGGAQSKGKVSNFLVIEDKQYAVVGSGLMLLDIVSEYCWYCEEIPESGEILLRHLADLLKQFNAKCYKLMLVGEAVSDRTGLTKITSTNLALLLRTLHLLIWLIPRLKLYFETFLTDPNDSHRDYLDQVCQNVKEHAHDVQMKLLEIINNWVLAELRYWEPKPPVPTPSIRAILNHLKKFHSAIRNVLPYSIINELFTSVIAYYKSAFHDKLSKYNITNDGGPLHGLVTSELLFYSQELKSLKVVSAERLELSAMNDIWTVNSVQ